MPTAVVHTNVHTQSFGATGVLSIGTGLGAICAAGGGGSAVGIFGLCRSTEDDDVSSRARNRAALLKITGEGPQLLPAKFYREQTKPERLVIGFDD